MKTKKNILVVGANSFIGHHLIQTLKADFNVIGVYHTNTNNLDSAIENIPVSEISALKLKFERVFIISAYIPGTVNLNEVERGKMYKANVSLVADICEQFQYCKIIYCSSVSVYNYKDGVITENDSLGGLNEYGISKLWGEKIVQKLNSYSIVRCSSVFGVGMNTDTIIPKYIKQSLQGKIIVYGEGNRQQNYIHVSDVVSYLTKVAQVTNNGIYLATSGESISNKSLADLIIKKAGGDIVFEYEDNSPSFFYNNDQTIKSLNLSPAAYLKDEITEIIKWIKETS